MITLDQLKELDIRIGTIAAAEQLEGSKKLIKLTVDFGDSSRTILAGIQAVVADPATLIGQQAPFLLNLEPKTILGVESQGMMLAASSDGQPVLLAPVAEVKPGSIVR